MTHYFLKSQTFKTLLAILILITAGLLGTKALFHDGFYTSHDSWTQVTRLYHFDQAMRDGHFPPRYSFNLLGGFGYPLFTFSYHMPWFIAEPFVLSGFSVFAAIRITYIIGFIISGLCMFFWLRILFGIVPATLGSFVYMWAPYRFSTIFVRGAMGEATSYIFMPLFFLGLTLFFKEKNRLGLLVGGIGFAGLLLSHAMIMFLLSIPILLFLVTLFILIKKKLRFILLFGAMGFLGISLAGYYVLPAVVLQKITIFDEIKKQIFLQQFPPLQEVLYSPWGYGAAFIKVDQMSMQLGITQWLVVGLSALLFLVVFMKRRATFLDKLAFSMFCSFSFCLMLMLPLSKPIWNQIKDLAPVDFPWRMLAVLTVLTAFLSSYVVFKTKRQVKVLVGIGLVCLALYANRNHVRVNQYTDVPLWLYIASEKTTNQFNEYLPEWVDREIVKHDKISKTSIDTKISNPVQKVNQVSFSYTLDKEQEVDIYNVYFPDMTLTVDGQHRALSTNEKGFVRAVVPAGTHQVLLGYKEPFIGKIGNGLSMLGLGIVITLLLLPLKRRRI